MEIFELRYFLSVAEIESVNQAAKNINISPGSLSKAVSRLEDELHVKLFFRVGRGIKLTPEGRQLKARATQILQLEEDTRFEIGGSDSTNINIYISSEEILQASFGLSLAKQINKKLPFAKIKFLTREETKAIEQVNEGEAHIAIITGEPPKKLKSKAIDQVNFITCASKKHPLVKKYGVNKAIPVEESVKHSFVSPELAILGRIKNSTSLDGWRDDKFPRQIQYKVSGLKLMENLIHSGMALGYLPDYFIKESNLVPLEITGCPYSCKQTVRLLTSPTSELRWLEELWTTL